MRFPQLLAVADMADWEFGHGDERHRIAGLQASPPARGPVPAGSLRALPTRASMGVPRGSIYGAAAPNRPRPSGGVRTHRYRVVVNFTGVRASRHLKSRLTYITSGWSARKQETRAASSSGGRKVIRTSPAEPGPGDAPAGIPVHSPVPRPGHRRHDIEPVRPPVVVRPAAPLPPASSTSIRRQSGCTSARRVNAPPSREALCRTELVANSEATRIASLACAQPPSHAVSSARASPTCRGSAG
jgi:hypothetical protein